ncbi:hypothetical protein [Algibacter sp. PT7-4]|uniref:hypothetical protein n=1 Tax=Algibacter ulvanivorans TaxID=3400999 RepID=UPI003AAE05BE
MKKIVYCLAIIGAIFTGCNPMDDINDKMDSKPIVGKDFIQGVQMYTFTSDDYEAYEGQLDSVEYFANQDLADVVIPDFLADKYPVFGEGSLVNVTYNLFDETAPVVMTASETLSSLSNINGYLDSEFETATNGTFVELTHNAALLSYTLSDDDIVEIANRLSSKYPEPASSASRFENFERRSSSNSYWSDDMIVEGLNVLLAEDYNAGQVVALTFAIYDGGTNFSETFVVQHNGYGFLKLDVEASASSATEYTLTSADYDDIAAALAADYPGPAENVGRFGSFDVRSSSDNYWNNDMLIEAFNIVLPAATEGDLYAVTYAIYDGSTGTATQTLKYESGEYVSGETVIEITSTVAKNNGDWEFPYTFTRADYDSFGFRFPNFSSSNIYILDIFLEDLFPFAQAGNVAMVQYKFYNGDETVTKYGHSNFDGGKWKLTPDIIETSFQYGYEDGVWVPDNTIAYMFLSADVALVESSFIDIYPGPADNVGFFGSFDRRSDSSNYWTDEMLLEVFNVVIDKLNPNAEEGQKYAITIVTYTGSTVNETLYVIKEGGVWVYQE